MPSNHSFPDLSFKAGSSCATTSAIYKAVYISSDNTVDIIATATTLQKFVGITQDYANTTGAAIPVRVMGPSKATVVSSVTVSAGDLVGIAINTTTANGSVLTAAGKVANTAGGSDLIIGKFLVGGGATGSASDIVEIDIRPTYICGFTTTVGL